MTSNAVAPSVGGTLRSELARKTIHLASTVFPLAYALGVARDDLLIAFLAVGAVALVIEVSRFRSTRVRDVFVRTVGPMLREHEHRQWSGATWLLAAYALSTLLFPRDVAIAAMLAAGLGDASAAIVGRTASAIRARTSPRPAGKTIVGSVACAVVTCIAAIGIASLPPLAAVCAAIAASLAERFDVPRVDDNVRVAVAAGVVAYVIGRMSAT